MLEGVKEYFDGTRELKRRAAAIARESERREEVRPVREGAQGFIESGAYGKLREQILGAAAATMPSPDVGLDSAGAFWFRRGLEQAINAMDVFMHAASEGDIE